MGPRSDPGPRFLWTDGDAKFFLGLIAIAFTVLIAALVYAAFHL
jgi:hypothetical protein